MKVILLEDIPKLGRKYEIKDVADGYARNYLIPRKKAKAVTKENLQWALEKQKEAQRRAEEELKKAQELATQLDGFELIFHLKVGEQNQLYESLTKQKIAQKLKEEGFALKSTQIDLEEPIKELGEYPVRINLDHNLEAEIRVIIEPENA